MAHYFAVDGSYGDADSIIIINTDTTNAWSKAVWTAIEEASDYGRIEVVQHFIKGNHNFIESELFPANEKRCIHCELTAEQLAVE